MPKDGKVPRTPNRYTLPGIEDICGRPAEEWGVDGRWIEPYDEAAALRTIWLLRRQARCCSLGAACVAFLRHKAQRRHAGLLGQIKCTHLLKKAETWSSSRTCTIMRLIW